MFSQLSSKYFSDLIILVARKPDYSSKSSSPIDEPSKYGESLHFKYILKENALLHSLEMSFLRFPDHPRTVEDAIKRVDALKKEMKTIMKMGKENVPNWDGKIKKKREGL